jgi:hypothetical protein
MIRLRRMVFWTIWVKVGRKEWGMFLPTPQFIWYLATQAYHRMISRE